MKMIERVRLIEEIGSADGCRGVGKWVRGWRRLRWLQRAVDTMPALLHVVFDPIRYEELDYGAVAARVGIGVDEVEHRFACALHYLQLVGRGERSVADAQAAVPRTEAELALDRVRWDAMWAVMLRR
ncbi:hypothetical protein U1769_25210 [Sphingomonas sp. ZT3P38]|uniref:hypothetical protein n=1 Tax=Parasphingomonas zepuensis TaxID=3096161 RepID=UPI002FC888C6